MPPAAHPTRPIRLYRSPVPTPAQTAEFTAWYQAKFGVGLSRDEAAASLSHIVELVLLLRG